MGSCALVAASDFNGEDFLARHSEGAFDFVIAADAGYVHLEGIGIVPDLAIGDFDSLGYVPSSVPVLRHPVEKDSSDMELAMEHAAGQGFDELLVYGALGRRLDHSIANLQLFAAYSERGVKVTAIDPAVVLRLLTGPASFDIPASGPGTVSVFSACDQSLGVTEQGMKYSLEGATLTNRTSLGLSNELLDGPARVSVESGTLYVFYPLQSR